MIPAPITRKTLESRNFVEIRRTISFLTPMFGGGVHVKDGDLERHDKTTDPVTILRGAAVRGQLRFWWRATHGCHAESLEKMRQKEAAIWGAASIPGSVSIRIQNDSFELDKSIEVYKVVESPDKKNHGKTVWNPRALDEMREIAYGAFPLQPKSGVQDRIEPGKLHKIKGNAELILTVPAAYESEVNDALDAWLVFGGVGGRTRRGFGVLRSENPIDPKTFLQRLSGRKPLDGVPSLSNARLVIASKEFTEGLAALKDGLGKLQRFRQGAQVGRNPKDASIPDNRKPVGRSRWPEPEFIRALSKIDPHEHRRRFVRVDKCPRAMFGMPIIFHFQEDKVREPKDTTLKPEKYERMASPLIIRPFICMDGKIGCLALVLEEQSRTKTPLVLMIAKVSKPVQSQIIKVPEPVQSQLNKAEANKITPLHGETDPLAAFLNFFAQTEENLR